MRIKMQYYSLASPRISIGFAWLQWDGRMSFNCFIVSSLIQASFPPLAIRESVEITPGPPAFVKIVRYFPLGLNN
jgi:hypothetical protein